MGVQREGPDKLLMHLKNGFMVQLLKQPSWPSRLGSVWVLSQS